jgi:hypothetical protein
MNMVQLLNPGYWLTIEAPVVTGLIGNFLFAFFVLFFVLGIVARLVASNRMTDHYARMIGQRIGTLLVTMGFLGLILFFFSYEHIHFFGGRFWYLLWFVGIIVWVGFIVRFVKRDIPAMREQKVKREFVSRYLPTKKKKKKKKR